MDLLTEIPDTTITITQQPTDTVISVPKKGELKKYIKETTLPAETVNQQITLF